MVVMDFFYTKFTIHAASRQAVKSGLSAMIIILLSGFVTVGYVQDPILLIPASLGAFVGTVIGVWHGR
jgi:hypothetical protein